MMADSV
jgi:hypothetical protein